MKMNEKCCALLKQVINENYSNIRLDNMASNDNEFYYEFKADEQFSENEFKKIEEEIRKLDKNIYVKLLRVSGVYFEGNAKNEMITRIVGKAFSTQEELRKYHEFLEKAKEHDHRKIGQDLDLFCFSDYVGGGLPLYTPEEQSLKMNFKEKLKKSAGNMVFKKSVVRL